MCYIRFPKWLYNIPFWLYNFRDGYLTHPNLPDVQPETVTPRRWPPSPWTVTLSLTQAQAASDDQQRAPCVVKARDSE